MLAGDFPVWFLRLGGFLYGALFGSFFNVAIYRWPLGMSVVHPPSHCPNCGEPVRAYRNVPIFGYLALRGRASCCGHPLTPRYLLVEVLGALAGLAVVEKFMVPAAPTADVVPFFLEALVYFFFLGGLIVATFVDLEYMEIPDEVSLPGTALALVTAGLRASPGPEIAALGAGIGYFSVQIPFVWLYERAFGYRGMGEGDSKLLMMVGAFLGWQAVLFSLFAGSFQGLLVSVPMFLMRGGDPDGAPTPDADDASGGEEATDVAGDDREAGELTSAKDDADQAADALDDEDDELNDGRLRIPFGPFLALGAAEYLFWGPEIVDAWIDFMAG